MTGRDHAARRHDGRRHGPTWALIGANRYFGIHSTLTIGAARKAAEVLLGLEI